MLLHAIVACNYFLIGDTSMKSLTIALLLSIAPVAIKADDVAQEAEITTITVETEKKCGDCNRAEILQDDRCCNLAELALIDATIAYEATSVSVTVSNVNETTGETMSVEGWNFIGELLPSIFGEVTSQTDSSFSFVFERGDMTIFGWFETLAIVEAKLLELKSAVEQNPNCVGGTIAFGLNK